MTDAELDSLVAQMRALHGRLRDEMRARWHRDLPLDEMLFDRWERARALGYDFTFDRITIIGDTPLDVECARSCGAVAVAVATGQHPADELASCKPDLLFGNLADVDRIVSLLTAP